MGVLDKINDLEAWEEFFNRKKLSNSFSKKEEKEIECFINNRRFEAYYKLIKEHNFPTDFPQKKVINKVETNKKRVVYSFDNEENIVLKFIAFNLYAFDNRFCDNCYAFRRNYGVKDAISKFKKNSSFSNCYCYKADISNYFNSIDVDILLDKLEFVREADEELFLLFRKILKEDRVYDRGKVISDNHGAMAGMPCSPFFANVYLSDIDRYFKENNIEYFRYSDDILFFEEDKVRMDNLIEVFLSKINHNKLTINKSKVHLYNPSEELEFLGFSYKNGIVDLSSITKKKLKGKIKRKANALRRWQRKKNLTPDKAAIGFIKAMNYKFFGKGNKTLEMNNNYYTARDIYTDNDIDNFTWSRWFFPNITVDKSLKEIDKYMQEYIRYTVTGRHYKGNYRIKYNQLKEWGYKSLVHEYYSKDY